jgi:hypothetical protein
VTSEPQVPPQPRTALPPTGSLRELAALVLLGANAVFLLVAFIRLVPGNEYESSFTSLAAASFGGFVSVETIGFPLLALLLVTYLGGLTARAKTIGLVALIELAVAAFMGVLFGFVIGLVAISDNGFRPAFEAFLGRVAWLAVLGVVAYAVFVIWKTVFPQAVRTAPAGGWAPQPGYGPPPPGYGQQAPAPGWGQQPQQPQQPQQQAPQSAPPTAAFDAPPPAAAGYGAQPGYGAQQQPAYGQPYGQAEQGYPAAYPQSGPPQHGAYQEPTTAFGRTDQPNHPTSGAAGEHPEQYRRD